MSIIRITKQKNFSIISNAALDDTRLTLKAKGIMAYLYSLPEKEATMEEIISAGPDGRDSISPGIKELIKHGYVSFEMEAK